MRRSYITLLLICAFGYVIATTLLLLTESASRDLNFVIRVAETALILLAMAIAVPHWRLRQSGLAPLLIFFVLYGLRLLYDVGHLGVVSDYQSPMYIYGYFFGLTFLPVVCIGLLYRHEDGPAFHRQTLVLLALGNILLFSYAVRGGDPSGGQFSGRIEEAGEIEGTALLNPLAFGMFGAMFAALLVGELASRGLSPRRLVLGGVGVAIAGANLLFGASRGPLLALFVAIGLLVLRAGQDQGGPVERPSRGRVGLLVAMLGVISAVVIARSDGSIFLIERFLLMVEQRSAGEVEARDSIYATAWSDFLSSPIIGSSYALSQDFASPHNIVLEALISTGIVGGVFFMAAMWRALSGVWRLTAGLRGYWGVGLALVATCMLVAGMTSSSIGQTPELWIFVALVTVISTRQPDTEKGVTA